MERIAFLTTIDPFRRSYASEIIVSNLVREFSRDFELDIRLVGGSAASGGRIGNEYISFGSVGNPRGKLSLYSDLACMYLGGYACPFGNGIGADIARWVRDNMEAKFFFCTGYQVAHHLKSVRRKKVIDVCDCFSAHFHSREKAPGGKPVIDRIAGDAFLKFEKSIVRDFDIVTVISERERNLLLERTGADEGRVMVLPYYLEKKPPKRADEGDYILFFGRLDNSHNAVALRHFLANIWPRVRAQKKGLRFYVAGKNPPPDLARAISACEGARLLGYVDDLDSLVRKSRLVVAPMLFCSGIQTKVLESMNLGKAVVATSIVADGLGAAAGRQIATADSPESMSAEILGLLEDDERRKNIGRSAAAFIRKHYSYKNFREKFALFMDAVSR